MSVFACAQLNIYRIYVNMNVRGVISLCVFTYHYTLSSRVICVLMFVVDVFVVVVVVRPS